MASQLGLTQAHICIGFTGSIGSGCSYIAESICAEYNYKYCRLSDIIREKVAPDEGGTKDITLLQNKGNDLRKTLGVSCLVELLLEKLNGIDIPEKGIVVDGIKNEGEVNALRMSPNFFLFSVHASQDIRKSRVVGDIFKTPEEFYAADFRDQKEDFFYGQNVKKCDYLSDVIVLNNKIIPETNEDRKKLFIREIYDKYFVPIEKYARKRDSELINPSVDELCMTLAYSMSKMSSCLKRKVGAIVASMTGKEGDGPESKERHTAFPRIVSSGYNDVPVGLHKCLYDPDFMMCYRDYLQQQHAQEIKYCPSCGHKITLSVKCDSCHFVFTKYVKKCTNCKKNIEIEYICPKCGVDVFNSFIPGSKKSPGKLLDMCRALHAEEISLLNLGNIDNKENLVLYTTTQPCNLCANKIVSSGIKKVVYTEPYNMPESENILRTGGVKVVRFQGIKSNAFFKLFA